MLNFSLSVCVCVCVPVDVCWYVPCCCSSRAYHPNQSVCAHICLFGEKPNSVLDSIITKWNINDKGSCCICHTYSTFNRMLFALSTILENGHLYCRLSIYHLFHSVLLLFSSDTFPFIVHVPSSAGFVFRSGSCKRGDTHPFHESDFN